jgi:hypothetical protein
MTHPLGLEQVAERIGGDAQEALLMLRHWSRLIDPHLKGAGVIDEREDKELVEAVRRLQRRLAFEAQVYAGVEAEFGLPSHPEVFEDADTSLQEVINFLEGHLPLREGRTPDSRRLICARVCLVLWRKQHGETPYSPSLWEACELYWQACGNPATSNTGDLENWRRHLLQARSEAPSK